MKGKEDMEGKQGVEFSPLSKKRADIEEFFSVFIFAKSDVF